MPVSASSLFRAVWPRHTAKEAARCAGMSVRTAEGWMQGAEPSAGTLMRMARRNDALRAELMRRVGETDALLVADRRRSAAHRHTAQSSLLDAPACSPARPEQGWLRLGG